MENNGSQTIATFTGTLLRREHALGQQFVQLIFRENDQDWLCVSTDPTTAKLPIGQNYRIEGEFKTHGQRTYIHEPEIALLKRGWLLWQRVSFAVVLLMGLVITGGVAFMHQHHSKAQSLTANNAAQTTEQNTSATSDDTDQPSQTTTSTPDTPTPPATATATMTTPAKSTTPTSPSAPSTPPTAPVTTPAPPTAPAAPQGLTTSIPDGTGVTLNWSASDGATQYQIWRDGSPVATTSGTAYEDDGLTPGQAYSYYVVAIDVADSLSSGPSNTASVSTNTP